MTSHRPDYQCPNCDGRLESTTDPHTFNCQRCGQLVHERPRTARVNRCSDGTVIGVAVFLSELDLRALDVDPTETNRVRYCVVDGTLQVQEAKTGDCDGSVGQA